MQAAASAPRVETRQQSQLLALLRDEGPLAKVELGERLELPRARLATEIAKLFEWNLVESGGPAASRGGRRSTLVKLADDLRFLAADIGATSVGVAITDARCEVLAHVVEDYDIRKGPVSVLDRLTQLSGKVLGEVTGRVIGAGVGLPGPVSFRDGMPVAPPIMPGWDRFPVRDRLASQWGCPVTVDNDVNVMALGERFLSFPTTDHLMFVKVATGIGCGIISDGALRRGARGAAGDLGHVRVPGDVSAVCRCGNVGCLEAVASGAAVARSLRDLGIDATTSRDVVALARSGSTDAIRLVREAGRTIGEVLATVVSLLNPSIIVIGGSLAEAGDPLLAGVREVVYQRSLPLATADLRIVSASSGDRDGVVGASVLAIEHVLAPDAVDAMLA